MDKEQKKMHEKLFGKDAVKKAEQRDGEDIENGDEEEKESELDKLLEDVY